MFDKILFHPCYMEIYIYVKKENNILMQLSVENILLYAGGNVLVVVPCTVLILYNLVRPFHLGMKGIVSS
jgi:hypothetical protein